MGDEGCGYADEGPEALGLAFAAAEQAAASRRPGHRPFDDPAVAAEPCGRLDALAGDTATDATLAKPFPQVVVVVAVARPPRRRTRPPPPPSRPDTDRRQELLGVPLERELAEQGAQLLRPTHKGERGRPGAHLFKPLRQVIESVNETFKGRLDLERHRGRTPAGVVTRVMQRILALTAAIWHNAHTGQQVLRSLTAFDH